MKGLEVMGKVIIISKSPTPERQATATHTQQTSLIKVKKHLQFNSVNMAPQTRV